MPVPLFPSVHRARSFEGMVSRWPLLAWAPAFFVPQGFLAGATPVLLPAGYSHCLSHGYTCVAVLSEWSFCLVLECELTIEKS